MKEWEQGEAQSIREGGEGPLCRRLASWACQLEWGQGKWEMGGAEEAEDGGAGDSGVVTGELSQTETGLHDKWK